MNTKPIISDVIDFVKSKPFIWLRDECGCRCGYCIKSEKRIPLLENAAKYNYGRLYWISVDDEYYPKYTPYIYYKIFVNKTILDK